MQPFDLGLDAGLKVRYFWLIAPTPLIGMGHELDNSSARVSSSYIDEQFVGHWDSLFIQPTDQSDVLGCEALLWIGKDYRKSYPAPRSPIEALIVGEKVVKLLIGEFPYLVQKHVDFCHSPHRYPWRVIAMIDDVWYSWPIIPRKWTTIDECV